MNELDTDTTTELLPRARSGHAESAAAPVFVDASGRRRRTARWMAVGALLVAAGYALMVIWSLLGGPVAPDNLMPFSAPRAAASSTRPAPSAVPSAAPHAAPNATSTHGAAASAVAASRASASTAATGSAAATASASSSATGHRPTSAPGKPTASPTTGHGR
jgi:hypothetical protein